MHDLQVAISELVTNSVRHAQLSPSSAVGIDVVVQPGRVRAQVTDRGTGFDPAAVPTPEPAQIGGWGLHIVERLTDRWGVERPGGGGSRVWFEMPLS
jgi:anti-sigma regulatory factor (Ser/Thr protein kinase)